MTSTQALPRLFNDSYRHLPAELFSPQAPTPVSKPRLIQCNNALAESLGIDSDWLLSPQGVALLAGNDLPEGTQPIATAYAGHQFGMWNPSLGDGRAILLGEIIDPKGHRFDVQLKGAGRTPYSRNGDGRSPLGPVLREYIVSEAMSALNVPSTRALAAVSTGEWVIREKPLAGGLLTRIAKSHIRIGTFEYCAALEQPALLQTLSDYTLQRLYPECQQAEQPYIALLNQLIQAQAQLVAKWQALGFIHGVMNTDNILLSGETIDYGPCAFLDHYHPEAVFSYIDQQGRYAYHHQAKIMHWNLSVFAQALLPLLGKTTNEAIDHAQSALALFPQRFQSYYTEAMSAKIGFTDRHADSHTLFTQLLRIMHKESLDYTLTYRYLTQRLAATIQRQNRLEGQNAYFKTLENSAALNRWLEHWLQTLQHQDKSLIQALEIMQTSNPIYIPRNHLVEQALSAAYQDDFSDLERLLACLQCPYQLQLDHPALSLPPSPQQRVSNTFCGT
ncbi:MAG: YdiU family protein [Cellvibrionaceae bacterium]|nr:YdiU family protein [Cellvibrionaceae bacterium]